MGGLGGGAGGAGGLGGLGNLVSGITDMFKNPEFTNAMSQLSQSMSAQAQNATTSEESGSDATPDSGESATQDTSNSAGASESGNGASGASAPPPLFNNPLFGDLAKELTETFNFEEMEKDGKPANIGEALGKFMSGNNPAKLMNLVGKFGSKLQQEVQRGSINPAELLQQTMGAMGGGAGMPAGMADMMQNMARNPQMQQMARNQSTRDRLRAKLDKKNADKQA
jgi:cell division ATPase FtsA